VAELNAVASTAADAQGKPPLIVVAGLLAQFLTGFWWVDAATSLGIVWFLVKEGREACKGMRSLPLSATCARPLVARALRRFKITPGRTPSTTNRSTSCFVRLALGIWPILGCLLSALKINKHAHSDFSAYPFAYPKFLTATSFL
jgi:hypothetical protein